jgi:hypothetical protein
MNAKLIKEKEGVYSLLDGNRFISTTECKDGTTNKLSRENCDEIFGVVEVEKLAEELYNGHVMAVDWQLEKSGFKAGFNKAMELNKDKLYTFEDMQKLMYATIDFLEQDEGEPLKFLKEFIQSIQQPTEIEVEVVMSEIVTDDFVGMQGIPKLDTNGCLILRNYERK